MLSRLARAGLRGSRALTPACYTPQIRRISSAPPPPPRSAPRTPPPPRPGQPVPHPKPIEAVKSAPEPIEPPPGPLPRPPPSPTLTRLRSFDRTYSITTLLPTIVAFFLAWHIFTAYFYSVELAYGISMLPTIPSTGCNLLISKYYRRGRRVVVGDVISFKNPVRQGEEAVKRVLGLEGDFVVVDTPGGVMGGRSEGRMVQVPLGHCWVVGDNLTFSRDSRMWGPLPLALVTGKVIAKGSGWMSFERVRNRLVTAEVDDEDDVDD